MRYRFDRKYICNKRLSQFILLHWYFVLLILVLTVGGFFIRSWMLQTKDVQTAREEYPDGQATTVYRVDDKGLAALDKYRNDEELLAAQRAYNRDSVYMQLDYENTTTLVNRYIVTADREDFWYDEAMVRIQGFWKEDSALEYLASRLEEEGYSWQIQDLRELVTFPISGRWFTINIISPDTDQSKVIKQAAEDYTKNNILKALGREMNATLTLDALQSYSYTQVERGIRDTQEGNINRVNNYATSLATQWQNLEDGAKTYYKKWKEKGDVPLGAEITQSSEAPVFTVSKRAAAKYALWGILPGLILGLLLTVVWFYATRRIWSAANVRDSFGIPAIAEGFLPADYELHRHGKKLWNLTGKWLQKTGSIIGEEELLFLLDGIAALDGSTVILTRSLGGAEKWRKSWDKHFSKKAAGKVFLVSADRFLSDEKAAKHLEEAERIILLESAGQLSMGRFERQLELISGLQSKIAGCVVVN